VFRCGSATNGRVHVSERTQQTDAANVTLANPECQIVVHRRWRCCLNAPDGPASWSRPMEKQLLGVKFRLVVLARGSDKVATSMIARQT